LAVGRVLWPFRCCPVCKGTQYDPEALTYEVDEMEEHLPYQLDRKCPKCGFGRNAKGQVVIGDYNKVRYMSDGKEEWFIRICRRCEYKWPESIPPETPDFP